MMLLQYTFSAGILALMKIGMIIGFFTSFPAIGG
jgi:hypothetical protein